MFGLERETKKKYQRRYRKGILTEASKRDLRLHVEFHENGKEGVLIPNFLDFKIYR